MRLLALSARNFIMGSFVRMEAFDLYEINFTIISGGFSLFLAFEFVGFFSGSHLSISEGEMGTST